MKKTFAALALLALAVAAVAATSAPPPGCSPGNGGMHPVCTPPN
jgi:hypothetical protein